MPNVSHELEPRFSDAIDADVTDTRISAVNERGWTNIESKFGHQLVAWVPLEDGGQLRTTSYNQNRRERVQSYVQKDGGINIGTEEWAGRRVVILVLDRTIDE